MSPVKEIERRAEQAEKAVVAMVRTEKLLRAEIERLRAALTKIQYLEASDADTWIWTAQETAREVLDDEQSSANAGQSSSDDR